MKLSYRGIQYNVAPVSTSVVDSGLTAKYRGCLYTVPQATNVPVMPVQMLRYRGITIGTPDSGWQPTFRLASV